MPKFIQDELTPKQRAKFEWWRKRQFLSRIKWEIREKIIAKDNAREQFDKIEQTI